MDKRNLKNQDLFKILEGIGAVSQLRGAKFAYAMAKNKRLISAEVEDLQKGIENVSEQYTEYDKKRLELCTEYSRKDDDGKPILTNNEFQISDRTNFDIALGKLRGEYKSAISERDKQVEEYNDLLDKPVNGVVFHKVSFEDLPRDISAAQTDMILELIEE